MTLHHAEISARRARIVRLLAVTHANTLLQTTLVDRTAMARKDLVYAVRTLRRDGIVTTTKDRRGNVVVTLVSCVPYQHVHVTPHRGCILR